MGLYKFRKELIEELLERKDIVFVSIPKDEYIPKLKNLGCKIIKTHVDRRGVNLFNDLRLFVSYINNIRNINPDIILTYTIKPNIYGGIASRITRKKYISNITGLGTAIENKGLLQIIALWLYKISLRSSSCIFFQNEPNKKLFLDSSIIKGKTRVIPGSGVNLTLHRYETYPKSEEIIKLLFIGRIMKAKGIDELLFAAKIIKEKYSNVHFDLLGSCEEKYHKRLNEFERAGIIHYYSHQDDVHNFISNSHATILPSYHEGTSNVLLESASTGRPVLASKVTGCIETFDEGISGIGFEAKNAESLLDKIIQFIELPYEKKKAMGIAGREKMEKEYNRRIIIDAYIDEINSTLGVIE
ncbi:MAG: glycosyltransferase family 4 protein [Bacteroidetes bacterium]|nr:glycosyltransferase family 4 protein [Bacteroidota bacterium]